MKLDHEAEWRFVRREVFTHAQTSQDRYGDFASTHEALGVLIEEVNELTAAIHSNKLESIRDEAIDCAAVCMRLAMQCRSGDDMKGRSVK